VTAQQPECDTILAGGQNLLQLTHPKATNKAAEPGAEIVESRWPHRSAIAEVASVVKWLMSVILETIFGWDLTNQMAVFSI